MSTRVSSHTLQDGHGHIERRDVAATMEWLETNAPTIDRHAFHRLLTKYLSRNDVAQAHRLLDFALAYCSRVVSSDPAASAPPGPSMKRIAARVLITAAAMLAGFLVSFFIHMRVFK